MTVTHINTRTVTGPRHVLDDAATCWCNPHITTFRVRWVPYQPAVIVDHQDRIRAAVAVDLERDGERDVAGRTAQAINPVTQRPRRNHHRARKAAM